MLSMFHFWLVDLFVSYNIRIPIIFEGDLAHIAASHLKKGDFVYIDGQLSTDPPPFHEMQDQTQVQVSIINYGPKNANMRHLHCALGLIMSSIGFL